jgi:tetratricopeptide (TPR) repeat protein
LRESTAIQLVILLPLLLPAETARDFFNLASTQFLERQFIEAKASFARATRIDASYAEAYRGLGMTDLELKDYNGAYRAWLKAVELNPKDEKSKYFLGRLFYEADLPNEAAAWLREALELSPRDYQAATYLGLCAEALGLDDTAGPLYRNALVESNAQNKPYSWAYLSLGNFLKKHGDETQALRVLEEGARKCPEAHELAAFGALLATHDQAQRAEEILRQAIALDPSLSQPHYRLGLLLKSAGRLDESKSEMSKFQQTKEQEDKNVKIIVLRK